VFNGSSSQVNLNGVTGFGTISMYVKRGSIAEYKPFFQTTGTNVSGSMILSIYQNDLYVSVGNGSTWADYNPVVPATSDTSTWFFLSIRLTSTGVGLSVNGGAEVFTTVTLVGMNSPLLGNSFIGYGAYSIDQVRIFNHLFILALYLYIVPVHCLAIYIIISKTATSSHS